MAEVNGYLAAEERNAERYARFMLRYRWLVIILGVIVTLLAASQIPKLDIRNDPDTLLPPTNRYVATNLYGEQKFGMGNLMVLGFVVKEGDIYQPWFVNMVQDIHRKMEALPTSRGYNFLDIAAQKVKYMGAEDGSLVFRRLIPVEGISTDDPQVSKRQLDFLKVGLEENPVLAPMLLYKEDADGQRCEYGQADCTAKGTFIIGDYSDEVKEMYLPWVRSVLDIADEVREQYGDQVEVRLAGEPYFLAYMLYDLLRKWWLFAISLAIVVVILWVENKNWRGALFPLFGVGATIVMTLGLMGFSQFKLTTMMVLTPMLLLAIGTGHAVQVTRRFLQEYAKPEATADSAATAAIAYTIVPATLAIITDMVGFATLATVDISFYKAYAYFGMFGMLTLLGTTTTLIPLLMSVFPPAKDAWGCEPASYEVKMGNSLTRMLTGPAKWAPILMVLLLMGWATVETNIVRGVSDMVAGKSEDLMPGVEKGINYSRAAFKEYSSTIQDMNRLGEVMPGVISVNIPIQGKEPLKAECEDEDDQGNLLPPGCHDTYMLGAQGIMNDAEVLAAMEKFEDWLRAHPYIGFTGSYAQYVKLVNMLLVSDPDNPSNAELFHIPTAEFIKQNFEYYKDPEDPEYVPEPNLVVSSYNGLLEANTSAGDLDSFVAKDWNEGIIMGFVNTMDPVKTHQVVLDIHEYLRQHRDEPGFNRIKIGLGNGDTITMPETGETVTVSGDPAITEPGLGGFLGATEATREVAWKNWLLSPVQTSIAIFIIAAIVFRSISVPIILTIMLWITLFAQYGLGGYFTSVENWSGNLAFHLLVTLSIAMGLGVDYAIYMISRLREEWHAARNWPNALNATLCTTGSAVFVSVIVLLGSFIPLVFTELANTWGLGVYIGFALIIDVITALTLIPLLVKWLRPKFVFGHPPEPLAQAEQA